MIVRKQLKRGTKIIGSGEYHTTSVAKRSDSDHPRLWFEYVTGPFTTRQDVASVSLTKSDIIHIINVVQNSAHMVDIRELFKISDA